MTQPNGKKLESDDDDADDRRLAGPTPAGHGFFSVYKKGQGYYTRLGTTLGAGLLVLLLCLFVYQQSYTALGSAFYTVQTVAPGATPAEVTATSLANTQGLQHSQKVARLVAVGLTAALGAAGAYLAWRLMNAPRNADFLISTDSEMKKVNWTSREELIGSTRVVILFLFVIAMLLFVIDVGTGLVFQLIGLLKFGMLS